MKKSKSNSC